MITEKMIAEKPKAVLIPERGEGMYSQMNTDFWLSGLRKELEEYSTSGWTGHERQHFIDHVREEITPHWPILGGFLLSHTSSFYDSYIKQIKESEE